VQIYVRTRGQARALDYQFLGQTPEDFWWRSYRSVTDIERPTILARSDGTSWQAYLAGITSQRLDSTQIPIQFNLALSGHCGAGIGNELALAIITRSAAGLAEQGGLFIPGDLLDGTLPGDVVERMLTAPGKATADAAADAVCAVYAVRPDAARPDAADGASGADGTSGPDGGSGADAAMPGGSDQGSARPEAAEHLDGEWIGGVAHPAGQRAFAALAAGLLFGDSAGSALVLNLVAEDEDLEELPDWGGALGVLSARPGPSLDMEVRRRGKDGPPPAGEEPERPRPRWRLPSSRMTLPLAGAVVAAAALAMLIAWLVGAV
jgi:hypothetical protein